MKAVPFAILSGCVFTFYSLVCLFKFDQPFAAVTAFCVGVVATFYPLYFEKQRHDALRDAQVAQYLGEQTLEHENPVFQKHIQLIKEQLESIAAGRLTLTAEQLEIYVDVQLSARTADRKPARYWATHFVDSEANALVWREAESVYGWLSTYVERQRTLLNAGGEVVRIFLFDENFMKNRRDLCEQITESHEKWFAGTRRPVTTLAALLPKHKMPRYEVTILDASEVFMWDWAGGIESTRETYRQGTYTMASTEVQREVSDWQRHRDHAVEPKRLFDLISRR